MNFAPKLLTCSLLVLHQMPTLDPNLLAVAIACNPATPAPITKVLAGEIVLQQSLKKAYIFQYLEPIKTVYNLQC